MHKIGGVVSSEIRGRAGDFPCPNDKKARRMDPHSISMETHHACYRRPSDYHHPRPRQGMTVQAICSSNWSLEMSSAHATTKDEHLPDQIEAFAHQAGLTVRRQLFQVLIEKADQELVLQHRHGKGGTGIQRRGTRPSPSRRSSARSPFSGRGICATITTARSRHRRRPPGTHRTSSPSPRISGTRGFDLGSM